MPNLWHKFITGLKRYWSGAGVEYVSEAKQYGNFAEYAFADEIKRLLPGCSVKTNVTVRDPETGSEGEIDCLILYRERLFVVEVKHWRGDLTEYNGEFIADKPDRYTVKRHVKPVRSPFRQVKRTVRLLKQMTAARAWVEPVVFFSGADHIHISTDNGVAWFCSEEDVAAYIANFDRYPPARDSRACYDACLGADMVVTDSRYGERRIMGRVDDRDLTFTDAQATYTREDIVQIDVRHHFSYDHVILTLQDGRRAFFRSEWKTVTVRTYHAAHTYALHRIDRIRLGH